jgi:hypothetical protein
MKTSKRKSPRARYGLFRVALLLLGSLVLVFVLSFRSTIARADDAIMDLGRHLVALSENGIGNGERGLLINGQSLGFRVFTVEQEMQSTLDFYESWCHGNAGDFPGQAANLALLDSSDAAPPEAQSRSWKDLVLRTSDEKMGVVACLKHGLVNPTSEELSDKLLRFLQTGNLRDLGQFHYAAVTRVGDVTRVVALWTEGDFFPLTMFPAEGDAPGFDLNAMSRPPSGRRMLSAGEYGHDAALTVYVDCEEDMGTLGRYYAIDFVKNGWRVLSDESPDATSRLFVVQRGGEMRAISVFQDLGERASVTFASAR